MNYRIIGKYIGRILLIEAILMLPALAISLLDRTMAAACAFAVTIPVTAIAGLALMKVCQNADRSFYPREGLVCVGLSWIFLSLFGCLPFIISKEIPFFVDAFFETVSGFTTTGASILTAVEPLSRGILYWRSFTHWVGGMGVLVFLLALDTGKGNGGFTVHLLRAESPGPEVGKLLPHMKDTAKTLYIMYVVLTVLDVIFLLLGGMSPFESFCTAFGTAGTGGFGVKNDSIASYSPYLQNVCTVFMLLFGVNFSCYYLLLLRRVKDVFSDEELRLYIAIIVGSIVLITWNVRGLYSTLAETLRHAAFQVATIITTTGFATTNFDLWPSFSKSILLCLMVVGACAGSTGGGLKVGRALLLFKNLRRNIHRALRPNSVSVVRNNGRTVSETVLQNTDAYLAAYVIIIIASFILISLDGFSTATNVSAVLACFNNIGPGLEMVGPTGNYAAYSAFSKVVLSFDMLAGRLEIFPILVLLTRSAWRKK